MTFNKEWLDSLSDEEKYNYAETTDSLEFFDFLYSWEYIPTEYLILFNITLRNPNLPRHYFLTAAKSRVSLARFGMCIEYSQDEEVKLILNAANFSINTSFKLIDGY